MGRRVFFAGSIFCLLLLLTAVCAASGRYIQQVSADTLSQLVVSKVEEGLAAAGETRRHEIELVRKPQPLRLPGGEAVYEAALPEGISYGGTVPVDINVYLDGSLYKKVSSSVRVHVFVPVVVSVRRLMPDQALQAGDLRLEERDLADISGNYFTAVSEAVLYVPARTIKPGAVLTPINMQPPVMIETGAAVTIVADVNGIQVKTEGQALEKGRAGEVIRVRNVNSRTIVQARVIDASTVQVAM